MDQKLQQDITTALFDNKEALIKVHPAAGEMNPATAGKVAFVETCPGSEGLLRQVRKLGPMPRPAAVVAGLVCLGMLGAGGIAVAGAATESHRPRAVVISNDGGVLASIPLAGDTFAVSYRNSIYGTVAEERYTVQDDGSYRLAQLAADQLAVLEEYYAVPGPPIGGRGRRPQEMGDRP